jgi:hypothetical protein
MTMAAGSQKEPVGKRWTPVKKKHPMARIALELKTPQGVTHGRSLLW